MLLLRVENSNYPIPSFFVSNKIKAYYVGSHVLCKTKHLTKLGTLHCYHYIKGKLIYLFFRPLNSGSIFVTVTGIFVTNTLG